MHSTPFLLPNLSGSPFIVESQSHMLPDRQATHASFAHEMPVSANSTMPMPTKSMSSMVEHKSALPKQKRKQVKNACINCQKACKKCDEGRACQRCVKLGIAATCVDSPRKERLKGVKRGPYKKRPKRDGKSLPKNMKKAKAASSSLLSAPAPLATMSSSHEIVWRPSVMASVPMQSPSAPMTAICNGPSHGNSLIYQEDTPYYSSPSMISSMSSVASSNTSPASLNMSLPPDTHQHIFSVEDLKPVNLTEPISACNVSTSSVPLDTMSMASMDTTSLTSCSSPTWWLPAESSQNVMPDLSQPIYEHQIKSESVVYDQQPIYAQQQPIYNHYIPQQQQQQHQQPVYYQQAQTQPQSAMYITSQPLVKEESVYYMDASSLDWFSNTPVPFA